MRYVFLCVFVSMIFVVVLWLVSLGQHFDAIKEDPVITNISKDPTLKNAVEGIQKQQQSLKEGMTAPETPTMDSEGVSSEESSLGIGSILPAPTAQQGAVPQATTPETTVPVVPQTTAGKDIPESKTTPPSIVTPSLPKSVSQELVPTIQGTVAK